ncbi:hypothetical protein [Aliiglaciecola lipolytica]|uniref:hypothetical protein n=1 Tax=Aliiglaciecola lipolytica TaxID=477689 RepID=UPI001C09FE48|nr:hypothetical protein [Aliiglaciecola lipolytica]MBU2877760.1 hypothetical protein [Aliiglaciecola lipolytica]
MNNDIYSNSKEIENLTNALIATDCFNGQKEALQIINEIKTKNYKILDLLDNDNFELIDDTNLNVKTLEANELLKNIEYTNAQLTCSEFERWEMKVEKPTGTLKRNGWHSLEESNVLWGNGGHSTLIIECKSTKQVFQGFLIRTLQDSLLEFNENFSLKVNFCSKQYFVKELEKNLFIVLFLLEEDAELMEVDIYYANPSSPLELGIGEDQRTLSVCLSEIIIFEPKGAFQ